MGNTYLYKLIWSLIFILSCTNQITAKKYAKSECLNEYGYVQIWNDSGSSFILNKTNNQTLIFQLISKTKLLSEQNWHDLHPLIFKNLIIIEGIDDNGNLCKLELVRNGKRCSIWMEIKDENGGIIQDQGFREIDEITFTYSLWTITDKNFRPAKNISKGFDLLKEWFSNFLY